MSKKRRHPVPKPVCLVTGAAGFIPFHVIKRLLESGRTVVGLDNFDSFYSLDSKRRNIDDLERIAAEKNTDFHFENLDLCGVSKRFAARYEIESIIHLAAKAGVRPSIDRPMEYQKSNIEGTLRLLEFAREREIKNLVFASSSSVYGNAKEIPFEENYHPLRPISPYAATKLAGEHLMQVYAYLYGMRIAMMRIFTAYGPRQRPDLAIHKFARLMVEKKVIRLYGDESNRRDYTHVSDTAEGIVNAHDWLRTAEPNTCEVFNLGSGNPINLGQLISELESQLEVKAQVHWTGWQPGDVRQTFASIDKARATIGFSPKTSFPEGIADFCDWFRSEYEIGMKRSA